MKYYFLKKLIDLYTPEVENFDGSLAEVKYGHGN